MKKTKAFALLYEKLDIFNKVVLSLIAISIVILLSLYFLFMKPNLEQLEFNETEEQAWSCIQLGRLLIASQNYMPGVTKDWSVWDDTYQFVVGENPTYEKENFAVSPLSLFDQSFLFISDNNDKIVSQTYRDINSGEFTDPPVDFLPLIKRLRTFMSENTNHEFVKSGFIEYNGTFYFISSAPILKSDETGPTVGMLTFGKEITPQSLMELANKYNIECIELKATTLESLTLNPSELETLKEANIFVKLDETNKHGLAYRLAADIFGNHKIVLTATNQINDYLDVKHRYNTLFVMGIMATLFAFFVLYLGVRQIVLLPVRKLTKQVEQVHLKEQDGIRADDFSGKEFHYLAESISNLLETIEKNNNKIMQSNNSLRVYSQAVESANNEIIIMSSEGIVEYVNSITDRRSPFGVGSYIGKHASECISPVYGDQLSQALVVLQAGEPYRAEIVLPRKGGYSTICEVSLSAIKSSTGKYEHFVAIVRDIDEQKKFEEKLLNTTRHDLLTNLPNRGYFAELFAERVLSLQPETPYLCVLFIDVDDFKYVNDSYGHDSGDILICEIASRMQNRLPENCVVSRASGDEFYVLADMRDAEAVQEIASLMFELFEEPFAVNNHLLTVSVSIGSSVYPTDSTDLRALLKNADMAMYVAKSLSHSNGYCAFTSQIEHDLMKRLSMVNKLRDSIAQCMDEFVANYQPKLDPLTNEVVGCEALLRWHSPDGNVSPVEFIPVAESNGLIWELSRHILMRSTKFQKELESLGFCMKMSVNMSPQVMLRSDFMNMIDEAIRESNINSSMLDIEITEETLASDVVRLEKVIKELHARKITVTIDDFGTGYSSIGYFKQFKLNGLKIDKKFIDHLPQNLDSVAIVDAVWAMARAMNLTVTAEGVETKEQFDYLKEMKIQEIQGYYVSKPLSTNDFIEFMKKQS